MPVDVKMKKILGFFVKGKKRQEDVYSFCDVSLPDSSDKNIPHKNGYKHYQFDSDCLDNGTFNSLDPRTKESNLCCPSESGPIFSSTLTDLFDLDTDEVQNEKSKMSQVSNFSQSSSVSSMNDISSLAKQEENGPPLEAVRKSTKNTYVITISNSKHFHIGSQKTININEKALPLVQVEKQSLEEVYSEYEANLTKLLDCEDKLTEEYIAIISQHANDKWKEFLINLGLEENFLDVLERRCDYDKTLTLYDGLHEYVNLFPSTSLSFVVDTLTNSQQQQQQQLIEKLSQEMRS